MNEFTLKNYLNNPEADAKLLSSYKKRYSAIKAKITSKWFIDKNTNQIVVVIKIPSEKTNNFYYDVIFEFKGSSPNDTSRKFKTLPIRVYSNCPSFVYSNVTFFKQKGWLIDWATSLYDPKTFSESEKKDDVKDKPKPNTVRYEKSLFYASLYLEGLNAITILQNLNTATPFVNTNQILTHIKDANTALSRRQNKVMVEKTIAKTAKDIQKTAHGIFKTPTVGKTSKAAHTKKANKIKHI